MIRPAFSSIRRPLAGVWALLLVTLAACDSQGTIAVVPEFEERFGFEGGLEGWVVRSADLPASTSVDVAHETGPAAEGQGWVRLNTDAGEPGGRLWIERPFEVTPGQSYRVTVSYRFSSADGVSNDPWDLLGGAATEPPGLPDLMVLGSTAASESGAWGSRDHTFTVSAGTAAPDGEAVTVRVALGVGILSGGQRTHGLDEVEVSFVRN